MPISGIGRSLTSPVKVVAASLVTGAAADDHRLRYLENDLNGMVEYGATIVDSLGLDTVTLVAHSMGTNGGGVPSRAATRRP